MGAGQDRFSAQANFKTTRPTICPLRISAMISLIDSNGAVRMVALTRPLAAKAAYETPALKKYASEFPPALVARDQLPFAVAELSTHDNQRVTKALNDGLQAALTGTKTPEQAMKDAQAEATRLLRPYQK